MTRVSEGDIVEFEVQHPQYQGTVRGRVTHAPDDLFPGNPQVHTCLGAVTVRREKLRVVGRGADPFEREEVAAWSSINGWISGSQVGAPHRYVSTFEVYRANYYGTGPKLYLGAVHYRQAQGSRPEVIDIRSDGDEGRIAAAMEQAGVILTPTPCTPG